MVLHYPEMILRPHLQNSVQFLAWSFKRDVDRLECVRGKTRIVKTVIFSQEREDRRDISADFKCLKEFVWKRNKSETSIRKNFLTKLLKVEMGYLGSQ